jgi:hypothetical protein
MAFDDKAEVITESSHFSGYFGIIIGQINLILSSTFSTKNKFSILAENIDVTSSTKIEWAKQLLLQDDSVMTLGDIENPFIEIAKLSGHSRIQYTSWEDLEVSKIDNVSFPIMAHSLSGDLEGYGENQQVNLFSSNQLGSSRGSGSLRESASGESNSIIMDNLLDSPSFHLPENSVSCIEPEVKIK